MKYQSVGNINPVPSVNLPSTAYGDETPWKSLNYDEKVERTRKVTRVLLDHIARLEREIRSLREIATEHQHDKDGEVITIKRVSDRYPQRPEDVPSPSFLPDSDEAFF